MAEKTEADIWRAFDLESEIAAQRSSRRPYREFLRVPALSCGVYSLAAGAKDLQTCRRRTTRTRSISW